MYESAESFCSQIHPTKSSDSMSTCATCLKLTRQVQLLRMEIKKLRDRVSMTPSPTCGLVGIDDMSITSVYDQSFGYPEVNSTWVGSMEDRHISFHPFTSNLWAQMFDEHGERIALNFNVCADKGFLFSPEDDAFICKKKNHFQITVNVEMTSAPAYIGTQSGLKKVDSYYIYLYGCKSLNLDCTIPIMQSNSDRTKKLFIPQLVDLVLHTSAKSTIGRLHFAQTTMNNTRRKGKRNPGQQYFLLIASLVGSVNGESYTLISYASDKLIVRTTNTSQSDGEMERVEAQALRMENSILRDRLTHPPPTCGLMGLEDFKVENTM